MKTMAGGQLGGILWKQSSSSQEVLIIHATDGRNDGVYTVYGIKLLPLKKNTYGFWKKKYKAILNLGEGEDKTRGGKDDTKVLGPSNLLHPFTK